MTATISHRRRTGIALAFAMTLMAIGAPAAAATGKAAESKADATSKTTRKTTRIKLAPHGDGGESAADRSHRMARECRGRPNAGACSGYGYGS